MLADLLPLRRITVSSVTHLCVWPGGVGGAISGVSVAEEGLIKNYTN